MPVVTVVKQKKKEEQDKAKGLAMRKAAMETYTSISVLARMSFSSQLLNMMVFKVNEIHL